MIKYLDSFFAYVEEVVVGLMEIGTLVLFALVMIFILAVIFGTV